MNDELKQPEAFEEPDEELEAEVEEDTAEENDADIDRYIRTLTGQEVPQEPEKEKKAPEVEHFRVTSQIGEDDHKAFIYYSSLLRHKWMLPAYIISPVILSVIFAFDGGQFYSGNLIISLVVLYAALAGMIVFRCTRWVSKIRKNNPQSLHITDTTMIFLTYSIVHLKNEKRTKVEYYHLIGLGETKKRFIMYFDNGKSMVFRKDDMPEDVFSAFKVFIQTKVRKKKFGKR